MASKRIDTGKTSRPRPKPATTPEGREAQLVSLAVDYAEQMMLDGTAPPGVVTHYLKLGSTRERLDQEKIKQENELLRAKIETMNAERQTAVKLEEALRAFRMYSGQPEEGDGYEA